MLGQLEDIQAGSGQGCGYPKCSEVAPSIHLYGNIKKGGGTRSGDKFSGRGSEQISFNSKFWC